MTWNHRVVRTVYKPGTGDEEVSFAIHEAHYNSKGELTAITVDPVVVAGEAPEELAATLTRMLAATHKPIIDAATQVWAPFDSTNEEQE